MILRLIMTDNIFIEFPIKYILNFHSQQLYSTIIFPATIIQYNILILNK
jgi:hypothetical protein